MNGLSQYRILVTGNLFLDLEIQRDAKHFWALFTYLEPYWTISHSFFFCIVKNTREMSTIKHFSSHPRAAMMNASFPFCFTRDLFFGTKKLSGLGIPTGYKSSFHGNQYYVALHCTELFIWLLQNTSTIWHCQIEQYCELLLRWCLWRRSQEQELVAITRKECVNLFNKFIRIHLYFCCS